MALPPFAYFRPESLTELENLLNEYKGRAKIFAGGTDLLMQMKGRIQNPEVLIDIGNINALRGISHERGKGTTILAGTKIADIEASPLIQDRLYALYQSVILLGSPQVRAMATIGGNLCNASPSAETIPILMALGSELIIARRHAERRLPIESFFLGYRKVDLKPEEYLKLVVITEQPNGTGSAYLCRMLRQAMEIDIVNVGVWMLTGKGDVCRDVRIALGSVSPVPIRAREAETLLKGRALSMENFRLAAEAASKASSPIDDIRGSAAYRRQMVKVLVIRALNEAFQSSRASRTENEVGTK